MLANAYLMAIFYLMIHSSPPLKKQRRNAFYEVSRFETILRMHLYFPVGGNFLSTLKAIFFQC
jgi:hypothetical protein